MLDPTAASTFLSNNLRNPPEFKDPFEYANEYCAIGDIQLVYRVFGAKMCSDSPLMTRPSMIPMSEYLAWEPLPKALTMFSLDQQDRDRFEKFLYAIFLKLILPHPRPTSSFTLIYAPLNASTFLKVLEHMHSRSVQAHRLSDVLSAILSNEVVTAARPPRSSPLSMAESKKDFKRQRICVKPFLAEFSTLVALRKNVLPFGFMHESLPRLAIIAEYEVKLGRLIEGLDFNVPHSALLFWNSDVAELPRTSLRKMFIDDEKGDRSAEAVTVRQKGVHVISTFNWNSRTETAIFWLRKDVVEQMRTEGSWSLYFLRVDTWKTATKAVKVADIQAQRMWTD